jgi:hypothetical protein
LAGRLRHYLVTGHKMNETDPFQRRAEKEIFFEALGLNAKSRKTGINKYEI